MCRERERGGGGSAAPERGRGGGGLEGGGGWGGGDTLEGGRRGSRPVSLAGPPERGGVRVVVGGRHPRRWAVKTRRKTEVKTPMKVANVCVIRAARGAFQASLDPRETGKE